MCNLRAPPTERLGDFHSFLVPLNSKLRAVKSRSLLLPGSSNGPKNGALTDLLKSKKRLESISARCLPRLSLTAIWVVPPLERSSSASISRPHHFDASMSRRPMSARAHPRLIHVLHRSFFASHPIELGGSSIALISHYFSRAFRFYLYHPASWDARASASINYHRERNHQGIGNRLITPMAATRHYVAHFIVCRPRFGGILNFYQRAAA